MTIIPGLDAQRVAHGATYGATFAALAIVRPGFFSKGGNNAFNSGCVPQVRSAAF
jgi:hypothetical protein